jgi:hypothetical protein
MDRPFLRQGMNSGNLHERTIQIIKISEIQRLSIRALDFNAIV